MGNFQPTSNLYVAAEYPPKYDWEEYKFIKMLGKGAFGEVYLVKNRSGGRRYALKKIKCETNDDLDNVMQELRSMSKLDHPHIMRQIDTRFKQQQDFRADVYMILEFCPGGTLNQRLSKPGSKDTNLKWMTQLSGAVAYIHAFGLVHRDLKPDNILLSAENNIKVGDFGLARDFVAAKREDETWEKYYMVALCGTLFYMAPEVFQGHYTEKADVFALGVLLYAIAERQCYSINGVICYGIFIHLPNDERAPLGMQMHLSKTGLKVPFCKSTAKIAKIIGSALLYDQSSRSDAASIHGKLKEIQ